MPVESAIIATEPRTLAPDANAREASSDGFPPMMIWVLGIGLVARLALLPWFSTIPLGTYDEKQFNQLAVNIVQHGEFSFESGQPTSFRPPLFPTFVAAVYSVAGSENFQAVRMMQGIINVLTAIVIFALARALYDQKTGAVAATVCLIYPSLWGHNYLLLTEVLFTFLLSLALLFLVRAVINDSMFNLAVGSVVLGLVALTRSSVFVIPPIILGWLLCIRSWSWSRRTLGMLLFLLCFGGTLTPWIIRNSRLEGTLTFVDSNFGRIFQWSLAPSMSEENSTPVSNSATAVESQGQKDRRALFSTLWFVMRKPILFLDHMARNFMEFWALDRELVAGAAYGNFGSIPRRVILVMAVFICGCYVVILWSGVLGAIMFPPKNRSAGLLLLLTAAHVCAVHSMVFGHSRYHIGVMPIVFVFAGSFLTNIRSFNAPTLRWRRWIAMALCGALLVMWLVQLARESHLRMLS